MVLASLLEGPGERCRNGGWMCGHRGADGEGSTGVYPPPRVPAEASGKPLPGTGSARGSVMASRVVMVGAGVGGSRCMYTRG